MSSPAPRDVLIAAGAYSRLAVDLHPWCSDLLLMDDTGVIRRPDNDVPIAEAIPAGVWYNEDVWRSAAAGKFLDCASRSSELRWLHAGTAGIDAPVYSPFIERGISITTSHGYAPGIADFVLAGVLDHWQGGPNRRALQATCTWHAEPFRELVGSRWLIIGFGSIGREIGKRARAFGAHVTGVRRKLTDDPAADSVVGLDTVRGLLSGIDVVVFAVSANRETQGIGDADFFARMKAGATLVNVARGVLINETALLAGLAMGRPGHAILDVFATEPLPRSSPFWKHPSVVVTSHGSWMSEGARARNDAQFAANLGRFLTVRSLDGPTDAIDGVSEMDS